MKPYAHRNDHARRTDRFLGGARRALVSTLTLGVALAALAGCGGSSTGMKRATSSACSASLGITSGERLVGDTSTARYADASGIALAYKGWVSGQAGRAGTTGAPTKPLCLLAKEGVADVLLRYSSQHEAQLAANSAANYGGRDLLGYLRGQGVACGPECNVQPSAQESQVASNAAAATSSANAASNANEDRCSAAFKVATTLTTALDAELHHPAATTGTALNGDVSALANELPVLSSQATTGERAQLLEDVRALGTMNSNGSSARVAAQALSIEIAASPIKNLPDLLGRICP